MLPRILRRLLWVPATLVTVSVITFLVLSFIPDPVAAAASQRGPEAVEATRRARSLDLPLFWNLAPRDARARALAAWEHAGEDSPAGDAARAELVRLGGAALPHVLPALDALPPAERGRAAQGLAPVAERMRLPNLDAASDPARAPAYWLRFWEDRGVEFRRASVESAVERISRYRSEERAAELAELDTFALDALFAALPTPTDRATTEEARAFLGIAARATGRDDRIAEDASPEEARETVERWRRFWEIHHLDFVTLDGPGRVTATVLETQYGRWAWRAVTQRLGRMPDGHSVASELRRRAPITTFIVVGALVLGYAAATGLGAVAASSRGRKLDVGVTLTALALFGLPTAVLAVWARAIGAEGLLAPTVVVAAGLVATPTRLLRSSLVATLGRDHVRAAVARGAGPARVIAVHGLRLGFIPVLTMATVEPPVALGGALVVEHVFGIEGIGAATIDALARRDVDWLMAVALGSATAATIAVLAADLVLAALDPRTRRFFGGSA
jgi:ABC-type dipeptide/oligopeptide/nickel transport system permease component